MGRSPCCEKEGLKKGPWTPEEDQKLLAYVEQHGHGSWRALPDKAGLRRCGKSCRLRWTNYLRPDIKRGKFSLQEEQTIIQLHALLGNRWSAIASHLPKRTDNEIKNFWNTHLKKRLAKMGIDPVTHKPRGDSPAAPAHGDPAAKRAANLSHMAQWESARLEAEARLVRESKLQRCSASAGLVPAAPSPVTSLSSSSSPTPPFPPPPPPISAASAPAELHNMVMSSPSSSSLRWQGRYRTPPSWVAGGGAAHSSQGGGRPQVDLESPTSTLTYSENFLPGGSSAGRPDHGPSAAPHRDEIGGEEAPGWNHFPAAMVELLDPCRERTDDLTIRSSFRGDFSWLRDAPFELGPGTAMTPGSAAAGGGGGDGFTEMLLNESDRHNTSPEDGGACGEESRGYWTSILNLVNSSSPPSSPAGF